MTNKNKKIELDIPEFLKPKNRFEGTSKATFDGRRCGHNALQYIDPEKYKFRNEIILKHRVLGGDRKTLKECGALMGASLETARVCEVRLMIKIGLLPERSC